MSEHEIVMPFVTVASKGGPHDDESYVAGYEMGLLDKQLESGNLAEVATIHAVSIPQADLLALRHGYTAEAQSSEVDGWARVVFTKIEMAMPRIEGL